MNRPLPTSCLLCGGPVATIGVFVPNGSDPELATALGRLRNDSRKTAMVLYALCDVHATDPDRDRISSEVEDRIVALADKVTLQ